LRELTFIVESNGYAWAKNMKRALQETCSAVSASPEKRLSDGAYRNLQKRYRTNLTRGEKELPGISGKPQGRREKMAKSGAHNLWERLKEHE
jgi:transposase